MAIDYVVDYDCAPKQALTTEGIIERVKARERAEIVIREFRAAGDTRPASEMGFEFTRTGEETQLYVVQDVLDFAAELEPYAPACQGCPANLRGEPFGCYAQISYPISDAAEAWLLARMPDIDEPILWFLLRDSVHKLDERESPVKPLRANPVYFEERRLRGRDMAEFVVTADHLFDMLFLQGAVQPAYAAILLLFAGAIPRALEASDLVEILRGELSTQDRLARYPFQLAHAGEDDRTIAELKAFFRALYQAWLLNVPVRIEP
jgi:hypothetical protein